MSTYWIWQDNLDGGTYLRKLNSDDFCEWTDLQEVILCATQLQVACDAEMEQDAVDIQVRYHEVRQTGLPSKCVHRVNFKRSRFSERLIDQPTGYERKRNNG